MWKWVKKNSGWVVAVVSWVIIIIGYAFTRGREVEGLSGLMTRVEKMEPEIKRINSLDLKTESLSNVLNREIIPNLREINKKLGPLPRVIDKLSGVENELIPIRKLVTENLKASISGDQLRDVFFDYERSTLRPDALYTLLLNAAWLRANPDVKIVLEGHTDERATAEYNLELGQRRAETVKNYLISAGVTPNRLSLITFGKERPFVVGHDESAWKWNRRVHFVVKER